MYSSTYRYRRERAAEKLLELDYVYPRRRVGYMKNFVLKKKKPHFGLTHWTNGSKRVRRSFTDDHDASESESEYSQSCSQQPKAILKKRKPRFNISPSTTVPKRVRRSLAEDHDANDTECENEFSQSCSQLQNEHPGEVLPSYIVSPHHREELELDEWHKMCEKEDEKIAAKRRKEKVKTQKSIESEEKDESHHGYASFFVATDEFNEKIKDLENSLSTLKINLRTTEREIINNFENDKKGILKKVDECETLSENLKQLLTNLSKEVGTLEMKFSFLDESNRELKTQFSDLQLTTSILKTEVGRMKQKNTKKNDALKGKVKVLAFRMNGLEMQMFRDDPNECNDNNGALDLLSFAESSQDDGSQVTVVTGISNCRKQLRRMPTPPASCGKRKIMDPVFV